MLSNVSIPQKGGMYVDSQIDLILFHTSGIYVIEAKNYSGPLVGRIEEKQWKPLLPGYSKDEQGNQYKTFVLNENLWQKWVREKTPSNPVIQNDIHIRTLKDIFDADYINVVIFSESMIASDSPERKTIKNIYSLKEFVDYIDDRPSTLSAHFLEEAYSTIKRYDQSTDKAMADIHKARI